MGVFATWSLSSRHLMIYGLNPDLLQATLRCLCSFVRCGVWWQICSFLLMCRERAPLQATPFPLCASRYGHTCGCRPGSAGLTPS